MVREVDGWTEYENGFRYQRGSEEELSFVYEVGPPRTFSEVDWASIRAIVEKLGEDIQGDPHIRPFIMFRARRDGGDVVYFHHPLPMIYHAILAERLGYHCKVANAALKRYDLSVSFAARGWRVFFGTE